MIFSVMIEAGDVQLAVPTIANSPRKSVVHLAWPNIGYFRWPTDTAGIPSVHDRTWHHLLEFLWRVALRLQFQLMRLNSAR